MLMHFSGLEMNSRGKLLVQLALSKKSAEECDDVLQQQKDADEKSSPIEKGYEGIVGANLDGEGNYRSEFRFK